MGRWEVKLNGISFFDGKDGRWQIQPAILLTFVSTVFQREAILALALPLVRPTRRHQNGIDRLIYISPPRLTFSSSLIGRRCCM